MIAATHTLDRPDVLSRLFLADRPRTGPLHSVVRVYDLILLRSNRMGICALTYSDLCGPLSLDEKTVKRALRRLAGLRLIQLETLGPTSGGRGQRITFRLLIRYVYRLYKRAENTLQKRGLSFWSSYPQDTPPRVHMVNPRVGQVPDVSEVGCGSSGVVTNPSSQNQALRRSAPSNSEGASKTQLPKRPARWAQSRFRSALKARADRQLDGVDRYCDSATVAKYRHECLSGIEHVMSSLSGHLRRLSRSGVIGYGASLGAFVDGVCRSILSSYRNIPFSRQQTLDERVWEWVEAAAKPSLGPYRETAVGDMTVYERTIKGGRRDLHDFGTNRGAAYYIGRRANG